MLKALTRGCTSRTRKAIRDDLLDTVYWGALDDKDRIERRERRDKVKAAAELAAKYPKKDVLLRFPHLQRIVDASSSTSSSPSSSNNETENIPSDLNDDATPAEETIPSESSGAVIAEADLLIPSSPLHFASPPSPDAASDNEDRDETTLAGPSHASALEDAVGEHDAEWVVRDEWTDKSPGRTPPNSPASARDDEEEYEPAMTHDEYSPSSSDGSGEDVAANLPPALNEDAMPDETTFAGSSRASDLEEPIPVGEPEPEWMVNHKWFPGATPPNSPATSVDDEEFEPAVTHDETSSSTSSSLSDGSGDNETVTPPTALSEDSIPEEDEQYMPDETRDETMLSDESDDTAFDAGVPCEGTDQVDLFIPITPSYTFPQSSRASIAASDVFRDCVTHYETDDSLDESDSLIMRPMHAIGDDFKDIKFEVMDEVMYEDGTDEYSDIKMEEDDTQPNPIPAPVKVEIKEECMEEERTHTVTCTSSSYAVPFFPATIGTVQAAAYCNLKQSTYGSSYAVTLPNSPAASAGSSPSSSDSIGENESIIPHEDGLCEGIRAAESSNSGSSGSATHGDADRVQWMIPSSPFFIASPPSSEAGGDEDGDNVAPSQQPQPISTSTSTACPSPGPIGAVPAAINDGLPQAASGAFDAVTMPTMDSGSSGVASTDDGNRDRVECMVPSPPSSVAGGDEGGDNMAPSEQSLTSSSSTSTACPSPGPIGTLPGAIDDAKLNLLTFHGAMQPNSTTDPVSSFPSSPDGSGENETSIPTEDGPCEGTTPSETMDSGSTGAATVDDRNRDRVEWMVPSSPSSIASMSSIASDSGSDENRDSTSPSEHSLPHSSSSSTACPFPCHIGSVTGGICDDAILPLQTAAVSEASTLPNSTTDTVSSSPSSPDGCGENGKDAATLPTEDGPNMGNNPAEIMASGTSATAGSSDSVEAGAESDRVFSSISTSSSSTVTHIPQHSRSSNDENEENGDADRVLASDEAGNRVTGVRRQTEAPERHESGHLLLRLYTTPSLERMTVNFLVGQRGGSVTFRAMAIEDAPQHLAFDNYETIENRLEELSRSLEERNVNLNTGKKKKTANGKKKPSLSNEEKTDYWMWRALIAIYRTKNQIKILSSVPGGPCLLLQLNDDDDVTGTIGKELLYHMRKILKKSRTVRRAFEAFTWRSVRQCRRYMRSLQKVMEEKSEELKKEYEKMSDDEREAAKRCSEDEFKDLYNLIYDRIIKSHHGKFKHFGTRDKSQTYGETTFEQLAKFLESMQMNGDSVFYDIGHGIGNVLLYMAAMSKAKKVRGIEINEEVYALSVELLDAFEEIMDFYGKQYCEVELIEGDFTDAEHREKIKEATSIYLNNFVFAAEAMNVFNDEILPELKPRTELIVSSSLALRGNRKKRAPVRFCDEVFPKYGGRAIGEGDTAKKEEETAKEEEETEKEEGVTANTPSVQFSVNNVLLQSDKVKKVKFSASWGPGHNLVFTKYTVKEKIADTSSTPQAAEPTDVSGQRKRKSADADSSPSTSVAPAKRAYKHSNRRSNTTDVPSTSISTSSSDVVLNTAALPVPPPPAVVPTAGNEQQRRKRATTESSDSSPASAKRICTQSNLESSTQ